MTIYQIEPGGWESATGESLPAGAGWIGVVKVDDIRAALRPAREWLNVVFSAGKPIDHVRLVAKELAHTQAEYRRLRATLLTIANSGDIDDGMRDMVQDALENSREAK